MNFSRSLLSFLAVIVGSAQIAAAGTLPAPYVNSAVQPYGRQLTAQEIVQRCISKLTDMDARSNAYLSAKVALAAKTPTNLTVAQNICTEILENGLLSRATAKGVEIKNNWAAAENNDRIEVGLGVLRTMTAAHQTFFSSRVQTFFAGGTYVGAHDFVDATEPAYFLTWALLGREAGDTVDYSQILKMDHEIKAIRRSVNAPAYYPGGGAGPDNAADFCYNTQSAVPCDSPDVVHKFLNIHAAPFVIDYQGIVSTFGGRLHSPLAVTAADLLENGTLWGFGQPRPYQVVQRLSATSQNVFPNIHQHFGGGILGSSSYIMMNWSSSGFMNGGQTVPRKMSSHILNDFLCVDSYPNLQAAEVKSEVQPSSKLEFRKNETCMQCHSQMDPLAYTYRNVAPSPLASLNGYGSSILRVPWVMSKRDVTQPKRTVAGEGDSLFPFTPPDGRLLYRDHTGKLAPAVLYTGIAQLGQAISQQDDFYICAAKRYYEYMTGVSVNIHKPQAQMSAVELEHFQNVLRAGLNVLKPTQSSEEMLKYIMTTPAFKYSDFRAEAKK